MAIFRLTPINLFDREWRNSVWRKPIEVRAPNETRARLVASSKLSATLDISGTPTMVSSPWVRPELVRCEEVEQSPFPNLGEVMVLKPKFARQGAQHH